MRQHLRSPHWDTFDHSMRFGCLCYCPAVTFYHLFSQCVVISTRKNSTQVSKMFDVRRAVHHNIISIVKPTRCTNVSSSSSTTLCEFWLAQLFLSISSSPASFVSNWSPPSSSNHPPILLLAFPSALLHTVSICI